MTRRTRDSIVGIIASLVVGSLVAWAGSQGSRIALGLPLFALCAAVAFVVNWLVFVPSFLSQTEHYFDLTGTLTYLTLLGLALSLGDEAGNARSLLLAALVATWAIRLGSFLFRRIRDDGSDGRFDPIKPHFLNFLMSWTLQGLWVFLTLSCALAAITSAQPKPLGLFAIAGAGLWAVGFAIEVVADRQKRAFRANPANAGRFITTGLWGWSRHPNYFGDILLWIGIAVIAAPVLVGWQWVTLISPCFVAFLLTRVSGIPLLEARGRKRWGNEPDYQAYLERTPALVPRPPRAA